MDHQALSFVLPEKLIKGIVVQVVPEDCSILIKLYQILCLSISQ